MCPYPNRLLMKATDTGVLTSPIGHVLQAERFGRPLLFALSSSSSSSIGIPPGLLGGTTFLPVASAPLGGGGGSFGLLHLGLAAHALLGEKDHLGHGIDKGIAPIDVRDGRVGQIPGALGNVPKGVRRLRQGLALEALRGQAAGS